MGAPTDGWAKSPRTRNADGTSAKDAAGGDRPGQGRKKAWASICRSDPQQVTPEAGDGAGGPLSGHATTARTDSDSGLRLRGTRTEIRLSLRRRWGGGQKRRGHRTGTGTVTCYGPSG